MYSASVLKQGRWQVAWAQLAGCLVKSCSDSGQPFLVCAHGSWGGGVQVNVFTAFGILQH